VTNRPEIPRIAADRSQVSFGWNTVILAIHAAKRMSRRAR
jgi:hypothetical protein